VAFIAVLVKRELQPAFFLQDTGVGKILQGVAKPLNRIVDGSRKCTPDCRVALDANTPGGGGRIPDDTGVGLFFIEDVLTGMTGNTPQTAMRCFEVIFNDIILFTAPQLGTGYASAASSRRLLRRSIERIHHFRLAVAGNAGFAGDRVQLRQRGLIAAACKHG
jgi:hypothetical protein